MVDFSVAIRTYNGEKRLPAVLEKLGSQVDVEKISWEIVIVDNNSNDSTAKLIREYQLGWTLAYPIKYYFEPKQGASFARQRAIQEAKAPLIGFLDDDNIPNSNWVAQAYQFSKSHPQAGAYGSTVIGDYEVEPPANFHKIASLLAVIDWDYSEPICFSSLHQGLNRGLLPPGAGLVIRKQAWLENVTKNLVLKGPQKDSLVAKGEDTEALAYIRNAGWEIWFNPKMEVIHRIPKHRLEKDYLIRLSQGVGLSRYSTRMLQYQGWQKPMVLPLYLANDLRKVILHYIKYGKSLETDVVAACQMKLLISSLISPFYTWRNRLFPSSK